MKTSLEIAQEAQLEPIDSLGARIGLQPEEIEPYGRYKAKISLDSIDRLSGKPDAQLVRVALQNLLDNAWKFTARHPRATIEVGMSAAGDGPRVCFVPTPTGDSDRAIAAFLTEVSPLTRSTTSRPNCAARWAFTLGLAC